MVEGVPGAGVHGPRDKIVDEFLAPVRGLFVPGDPKTTVDRMVSSGDTVMCESRGIGDAARRSDRTAIATPGASTCAMARSLPFASTWTVTTSRPCSAAERDADRDVTAAAERGLRLRDRRRRHRRLRAGQPAVGRGGVTVALIEAGPPDDDPAIRVPAMVAKAIGNPRQSWGYQTVPQRHVDNRVLPVPRGRVLGGCSSINGMVYFRGHPREYDEWQQPGWRYADLLPYFQRLENYEAAHTPQRARGGPVNVIDIPRPNPLVRRFLAAADSLGLPRCADFNGGDPEGFGPRQAAIRNGRRESGVTAYLNPVRHRPNLKIVTGALVTRVLFDGRRATGVEIERGGARSIVQARREVIVACGAYGSPQLLQLSGVGDAAALAIPGHRAAARSACGRQKSA